MKNLLKIQMIKQTVDLGPLDYPKVLEQTDYEVRDRTLLFLFLESLA